MKIVQKKKPGVEPSPGRVQEERSAAVLAAAPKRRKTKSVAKKVFNDILAFDSDPLMDQPITTLDGSQGKCVTSTIKLMTSRMEK